MTKSKIVFVLLMTLLCVNYTLARGQFLKINPDRAEAFRDEMLLPQHTYLQALGLNYNGFTSSMVWIGGLLYYGSYRIMKVKRKDLTPPQHLDDYAKLMVNIDPRFKSPFEWYASVYLYSRTEVKHEDLEKVNNVLDIAIKHHPTDYKFPYMAGLNYIGYSAKRDPKTRIKELERGITYLEQASQFKEAPDYLPFTVASMYRLKAKNEAKLKSGKSPSAEQSLQDQREFYYNLYQSTIDEALLQRLGQKLLELGMPPSLLQQTNRTQLDRFKAQFELQRTYLPLDLWVWTQYPTEDKVTSHE